MRKLAPALFALLTLALSACGTPLSDAPTAPAPAALITDADLAAAPVESGGPTTELALRETAPAPQGRETTLNITDEPTLSAQDVLPEVSGYVVYVKGQGPLWKIERVNQKTDQKITLYAGLEFPTSLAISGNGTKLYFTTYQEENGQEKTRLYRFTYGSQSQLSVLASSSSKLSRLENVSTNYEGNIVAWEGGLACNTTFTCFKRVIKVRTYSGSSHTTKTVSLPSTPYQPSISSDGKKLVFLQKNGSTTKVQHLYLQTNDLQLVASGNKSWYSPSVSNNGKVAWIESANPGLIKVKTLLSGNTTNVNYPSLGLYSANITGDGTYLGFSGYGLNGSIDWEVRTMNINYNATALVDSGHLVRAFWQK